MENYYGGPMNIELLLGPLDGHKDIFFGGNSVQAVSQSGRDLLYYRIGDSSLFAFAGWVETEQQAE